jgi:hypothetical protein
MPALVRRGCFAALVALSILFTSGLALGAPQARQMPQAPQAPPAMARQGVPQPVVGYGPSQDAEQTRRELGKVLAHYSPAVGHVLALDPLLLQNAAYLAPYPELVAFLNEHPEVARNASFYFSEFRNDYYYTPQDHDSQMIRMWSGFLGGVTAFLVFCVITGLLVWLIKTVTDNRRWARLFKAQTEARNKLLDRFGTNEDLLAYIATPAGKRFLESTPIDLGPTSTSVGGPMRRILWATEMGVVLACGGGGLMIARQNLPGELPQMMWLVAVFAISIGIGFILAAGASYLLSRRMGILGPAVSRDERTTDAHPTE